MIYCPLPSDLYNLCQQPGKQIAFKEAWDEGVGEKAAVMTATASLGSEACRALSEQKAQNTLFTSPFTVKEQTQVN